MAAKYEIILKDLSQRISQMEPGTQLPSEQQLAAQYGVSNMTVRRALQLLSDTKRIVGVRGRGTFVAQPRVTKKMTLASFTETMRAAGRVARTEVLSMGLSRADEEAAAPLGLDPGAEIYTIERLRFGDDTPLCIDRTILPAQRFPGLLGADLTGSLYELLARRYGVELSRVKSRVSAVHASAADAALLGIDTTTPCLRVTTRSSAGELGLVEATTSLNRGDLYELDISPEDGEG